MNSAIRSKERNMKILIIGAGPLGSIFAVRLYQAGRDVSLLARGSRLEELRQHGVVLENSVTGQQESARVPLVESFGPSDDYDLVMVVMRKNQALELLPLLAANRRVPTYLFMMNNAAGQEPLIQALGKERVMAGFPLPGGERAGHVMRIMPVDEEHRYTLPVGEVDARITERAEKVAQVLGSMRGYEVDLRTDIDDWLKCHVAVVGPGLGAALYAAGTDLKRLGRTPDALLLGIRAMKEALHGLEAAGIPLVPPRLKVFTLLPEPVVIALMQKLSEREDLKAGTEGHARAARDEMALLNQEFADFLHSRGIQTPYIDRMSIYFDPAAPTIPEGSREIEPDWRPVFAAGLLALGLGGMLLYFLRRGRS
jgi:ketopantoate reductase